MQKIVKRKNNNGFTLVELLVVIVIIAILSMTVVAAVTAYMNKGKEEYNKGISSQVSLAAEGFYPENSSRIPVAEGDYDYVTLKELASLNYIKGTVVDADERNCMEESYVVVKQAGKKLDYTVCLLCGEGENKKSYIEDEAICDVKNVLEQEEDEEIGPSALNCKIEKVADQSIKLTITPESEIGDRIINVIKYRDGIKETLEPVQGATQYDDLVPGKYKFGILTEKGEQTCNGEIKIETPQEEPEEPEIPDNPEVIPDLKCSKVTQTKINNDTQIKVTISVNNYYKDKIKNIQLLDKDKKFVKNLGSSLTQTLGYGTHNFKIESNDGKTVTCASGASLTLPGIQVSKYYATQSQYNTYKNSGKLTSTQLGKLTSYDGSWKNGYVYVVVTNPEHFNDLKYKIDDTTKKISNNHFWITKEGNKTTTVSGTGKGTTTTKTANITTKLNRTGPEITIKNPSNGNWVNTDLTLTITVTDSSPGILKVEYSYDNKTWTERETFTTNTSTKKVFSMKYTATQSNTIYVRATDKAGNQNTNTSAIKIDKVKPEITLSNSSAGKWINSGKVNITVTATDKNSKIDNMKYKYDSGSWNKKTSFDSTSTTDKKIWTPSYSDEQNKVFYVYATDKAGNTSVTKSTNIKIDKSDPTISFSVNKSIQDGGWYKASDTSPVKITVTCNAAISGKDTFKINSSTKSGTSYTVTLKKANRPYTVKAECTDNAGNKETATKEYYTRTYQENGCATYYSCEASACGAASCRNSTCSCAKYGTKYQYKWVKTHTGLKTTRTRGASTIASSIGLPRASVTTCNSSRYLDYGYSSAKCISCVRGGTSAAPDCTPASNNHCNQYSYNKWQCRRSTVTDKSNCITRNSCASASKCGYKTCATSACGCKTKKYSWQY